MVQVEVKLIDIVLQSNSIVGEFGVLQVEVESFDKIVKELVEQLEFIKNFDIQGVLDSIIKYFQMFFEVEKWVNVFIIDFNSIVEQFVFM